jgi:hypothetical protein
MCSAAALTRLLRELGLLQGEARYRGLLHQPGGSHVPDDVLSGALNAVVDFRYSTSPRLDFWFDHHVSGLAGDEERRHFEADASGRKFFDPAYGSCCKLIADIAATQLGVQLHGLEDMVRWADVIDSASFADAKTAVELAEPALQLMAVIEHHGDDAFVAPRIARLASGATLDELAAEPEVQRAFAPLLERQKQTVEAIRARARFEAGVIEVDLVGTGDDRYNKFIPYALYPDARYAVVVTASRARSKVSVGSNPWASTPRTHDIAALCAMHGGGGHPVVGAVSLRPDEQERARGIACDIAGRLRSEPQQST